MITDLLRVRLIDQVDQRLLRTFHVSDGLAGTVPDFQAAKRFSSFGTRSANVVSPATTRTELFGRTQVV